MELDMESDTECDTECDTQCKEWEELETQIQQLAQSHEDAVASLERIQEALSTEIRITQDGDTRDFEEVLDELHAETHKGTFWKSLLEVLERSELL